MSAVDELVFRPLKDEEMGLVDGLVANVVIDDEKSECWGVTPGVMPANAGEAWGMFLQGGLTGAAWFRDSKTGVVEITALVLPRRRWRMGLMVWMAGEIAKEARARGAGELLVRLTQCSAGLAEEMEFALFTGPDPTEEGYPNGEWRRQL